MFGALLRFARQVVENVLSQLMQQFNVIEQQARNPMQAMIQQVVGGVWIGEGANAFVEEVSSLMLPGVGQVGEHITTMHRNLNHAIDVMDQADQQVTSLVGGLGYSNLDIANLIPGDAEISMLVIFIGLTYLGGVMFGIRRYR